MTQFSGKNGKYRVGEIVAQNNRFRIRNCSDGDGRELLFQVATEPANSGEVARNGLILSRLATASDKIEKAYTESGHEGSLNYSLGFPELLDTFVIASASNRQANVIGFRGVETVGSVIPLVKFWKDSLRVDLPSSAWIMGKLLKTISFAHDNRIEIGQISGNNVLLEPDIHYVLVFDWSKSVIHDEVVPSSVRRAEIQAAAQLVIKATGDLDEARVNDADLPYTRYLQSLAVGGESSASKAHSAFYGVVDSLCKDPDSTWKSGFHKFSTRHA